MTDRKAKEQLSILALTQVRGLRVASLRKIYEAAGSASELFENLDYIEDFLPGVQPALVAALSDKSIFERAEKELAFALSEGIKVVCIGDEDYPYRLNECEDAPLALYTLGDISFNARHVVAIVGTRHATPLGKDICEHFVTELAHRVPDTLVVSGLAYGIDICAHRAAVKAGLPTIGVLAHGLDTLYPNAHRNTAKEMLQNGGLATEFMSETAPLPANFLQRNRIVAGLADATVVVESASKGGSLVTASIAQSYARDCFAFPGRVSDQYSAGCNDLICRNKASLITCAADFVDVMGWHDHVARKEQPRQLQLFPQLTPEQQQIVDLLQKNDDGLQINEMVIELNTPINRLMPILLELEMQEVVATMAGGRYRVKRV